MERKPLPKATSKRITDLLKEMESAEGRALRAEGQVVIETMEALWYVAYKTDAAV